MPGVTKEGKPVMSYGYDIGGKVVSSASAERGEKMPQAGSLGRLDSGNTDRSIMRKGGDSEPSKTYAKTGYESTAFTKYGCVKGSNVSDPKFLEADGSWAPAEGRGSTGKITKQNRNAVIKK